MAPAMKVRGKTTELMDKENSFTLTATFMKVIGSTIKLMAMESTFMLMELVTKVCGRMIFNMVEAKKVGQTEAFISESTWLAKSTGEVFTAGTTAVSMMAIGTRIRLRVLASTLGLTAESIEENGLTTTWMVLVFILGKMVESMKVNTKTIKNMVLEFIFGLMDVFIKAIGTRVSSIASASTLCLVLAPNAVFGRKVKGLNGLTTSNKDKLKAVR